MNPVSTRIELGCLGLMGTFWIGASSPRFYYPVALLTVAQHSVRFWRHPTPRLRAWSVLCPKATSRLSMVAVSLSLRHHTVTSH